MAQNWTLQSFTESARTWTIQRTLHIACHLNLFDGIPPDGIDARKLAFSMELHTRALEVFCNALTSLELLEKSLVRCLNPKDRVYKLYKITESGKEIIKSI